MPQEFTKTRVGTNFWSSDQELESFIREPAPPQLRLKPAPSRAIVGISLSGTL